MNTNTLNDLLLKLIGRAECHFIGVRAADQIPSSREIDSYPACIIINTDPSTQPGSHWVAYFYESPNCTEFFDSFGLDPRLYRLASTHVNVVNTHPVQAFNSTLCGQHCAFYLFNRSRGYDHNTVLALYTPYPILNDQIVKRFAKHASHLSRSFSSLPILHPQSCISCQNCFSDCKFNKN